MADVKYEDEKLLTSDEFIKTAKENADKNLQIQKDTAQKVFNSTYASLERQYDEAATAAGVAKQRNLIDTDTAYQRQELKYGAEQEALAAAGLSGSGMNEYRRAQSYQKNREDRQMSYAEYDRALREAAYTRDQGKLAADITKAQADADADILYNDTMTSISEKELGYADLERQEIDTAYSGYLEGIDDGTLTLDQIKADSSWAKLSPEQQGAVEKAAKVKGLKTKIDNGESWEDIQSSYAYLELDDDGRNQVAGYHAQVVASKTKDAEAALGSYLEMANAGWSIDDIVAAATGNGHYNILTESGSWQSVVNAVDGYAKDKAAEETDANFSNWLKGISDGSYTLADVQAMSGYDKLTPEQKTALTNAATEFATNKATAENEANFAIAAGLYEEWLAKVQSGELTPSQIKASPYYKYIEGTDMETSINAAFVDGGLSYITALETSGGALSLNDVKAELSVAGYGSADIESIIKKWQESNYKEYASNDDLNERDIAKALKLQTINEDQAQALRVKIGTAEPEPEPEEEGPTPAPSPTVSGTAPLLGAPNNSATGGTEESNTASGPERTVEDEEWYRGEITSAEYVASRVNDGTGSAYESANGWFIHNLGTGVAGDDVAINIGEEDYNSATKFKLTSTGPVSTTVANTINSYLADNGIETPSSKNEGSGWFFGVGDHNISSKDGKGAKLIVYDGHMYLYSKKGWVELVDRNTGEVPHDAIATYLYGESTNDKAVKSLSEYDVSHPSQTGQVTVSNNRYQLPDGYNHLSDDPQDISDLTIRRLEKEYGDKPNGFYVVIGGDYYMKRDAGDWRKLVK